MLSYLGVVSSVGPRDKELPITPQRLSPSLPSEEELKKPLSPSQLHLEDLGISPSALNVKLTMIERKLAALTSQHINLSHVVSNLENLLPPNPATNDTFARMELEKKLEEVKRERSGVEKEKMEVGILITRLRRKLDDEEGRDARDSFIWSRKWSISEE